MQEMKTVRFVANERRSNAVRAGLTSRKSDPNLIPALNDRDVGLAGGAKSPTGI